jgi:sulfatase maturation enzyme AslB (radical SAM superfamily)
MPKKKKPIFCSHLYTSLSFDQKGQVRVCCNNYEIPKIDDRPINVNDKDFSMKKVFNSDLHLRIRTNLMNGVRDASCLRCWQTEENGAESYRTIWNNSLASGYYKDLMLDTQSEKGYIMYKNDSTKVPMQHIDDPYVTFLEFSVGNRCNLICRMCNVDNSHLWEEESRTLFPEVKIPTRKVSVDEKFLSDEFFKENFTHIKQVNFLGGEPLLVKEHQRFLEQCVKFGIAENIVLFYTTNLTANLLKDGLKELWKEFRHIYIGMSIDGVDKVNEYIRFPSKWKDVNKSIDMISEWKSEMSMDLQIQATMQTLNLTDWHNIIDWTYSLGDKGFWKVPFSNWVSYPNYYDCRNIPKDIKEESIKKIKNSISKIDRDSLDVGEKQWLGILESNLVTVMENHDQSDSILQFSSITKKLDISRKQHLSNFIPDLAKVVYK